MASAVWLLVSPGCRQSDCTMTLPPTPLLQPTGQLPLCTPTATTTPDQPLLLALLLGQEASAALSFSRAAPDTQLCLATRPLDVTPLASLSLPQKFGSFLI